jgi:hypothetical protein
MNAVTEVNQNTAVAAPGGYDPYAAYGQEAANAGAFLKFSKGEWQTGQNADEVALGRRLAANMDELSIGWIRWADGKPAERRMGLLAQGYKPEPRDTLGYTDQTLWEVDEEDRPKDPWTFTNELPLADPEDGEQMTYAASSKGGIGCIGNLCKAFARAPQRTQGLIPVLELGRDSYMHPVYKKTYVPVLNIVDWVANGSVPIPQPDGGETPEPETPAAEKAAGAKTRF